MAKLTISIPDDVYEKLEPLKGFFNSNNFSGIIALGIETLNWIKSQSESNYTIFAVKKTDENAASSRLLVKGIPLIILSEKSDQGLFTYLSNQEVPSSSSDTEV